MRVDTSIAKDLDTCHTHTEHSLHEVDTHIQLLTMKAAKVSCSTEMSAAPVAGCMNLDLTRGREEERGRPCK